MSLTVTGLAQLGISALGADVTTIDASAKLAGGIVQTGRSTTGAVTYTGGAGGDTFMMTNLGDTMVGGKGTDTLDLNYAAILGGINVNLGSTTNQIVSANGGAIAGSVTGFENVDLAGYTGSFGAMVTSGSNALLGTTSVIVGTANADQINGGSGADTITAGDGKDVISAGGGNDRVKGTAAFLITDVDVITLGSGTDTIEITDVGVADFSGLNAFAAEAFVLAADGGADAVVINDGQFNTGAVSITLTGATDAHNDTITIENGGTNFAAAAEATAAGVNAAGKWHFAADVGDDGVLTFYNETNAGVSTLTIVGLDAGALTIVGNDLLFTA
jgi:hypothetical protein